MKSSRIMKIFEQYVRKYDMNNINIKAKYFHSLKVMEISKDLASGLGIFSEEAKAYEAKTRIRNSGIARQVYVTKTYNHKERNRWMMS